MPGHSGEAKLADLSRFIGKDKAFNLNSVESPLELRSRLKREEAEAEHSLRAKAEEGAHQRLLTLLIHIFVMAVVAIAFLASVYIAVTKEPATGLPDKAMGIITAIVAPRWVTSPAKEAGRRDRSGRAFTELAAFNPVNVSRGWS